MPLLFPTRPNYYKIMLPDNVDIAQLNMVSCIIINGMQLNNDDHAFWESTSTTSRTSIYSSGNIPRDDYLQTCYEYSAKMKYMT